MDSEVGIPRRLETCATCRARTQNAHPLPMSRGSPSCLGPVLGKTIIKHLFKKRTQLLFFIKGSDEHKENVKKATNFIILPLVVDVHTCIHRSIPTTTRRAGHQIKRCATEEGRLRRWSTPFFTLHIKLSSVQKNSMTPAAVQQPVGQKHTTAEHQIKKNTHTHQQAATPDPADSFAATAWVPRNTLTSNFRTSKSGN